MKLPLIAMKLPLITMKLPLMTSLLLLPPLLPLPRTAVRRGGAAEGGGERVA